MDGETRPAPAAQSAASAEEMPALEYQDRGCYHVFAEIDPSGRAGYRLSMRLTGRFIVLPAEGPPLHSLEEVAREATWGPATPGPVDLLLPNLEEMFGHRRFRGLTRAEYDRLQALVAKRNASPPGDANDAEATQESGLADNASCRSECDEVLGLLRFATQEKPFNRSMFSRVAEALVEALASGELKGNGAIALPEQSSDLTVDGRFYVTADHPQGPLYLFVTWRGKASNLKGYIYAPRASDGSSSGIQGTIAVIGPCIDTPGGAGPVEVEVENRVGDHWYRVYRNLD